MGVLDTACGHEMKISILCKIRYSFQYSLTSKWWQRKKCWHETTSKRNLFQSPFSFLKVPDMCVTTERENRSGRNLTNNHLLCAVQRANSVWPWCECASGSSALDSDWPFAPPKPPLQENTTCSCRSEKHAGMSWKIQLMKWPSCSYWTIRIVTLTLIRLCSCFLLQLLFPLLPLLFPPFHWSPLVFNLIIQLQIFLK